MIRILVRSEPGAAFEPIDIGDVESRRYDLIWADIGGESTEETGRVLSMLNIDAIPHEAGDSNFFQGRINENTRSIHMVLNAPQVGEVGRQTIDRIDVYMGDRVLVTEHDDPVPSIDKLWDPSILAANRVTSAAGLAALLSLSAGRQMVPLLEELEVRIDSLEDKAFAADPRTLTEAQALRRDLITLRRIAGRQRTVMEEMSISLHPVVDEEGKRRFARASNQEARIVEAMESARSLLATVLDTYRGAVADQTNEIVRLLTVLSAIFLPLGLIAGIFGMNFIDLPTIDEPWGFWLWIGVMAVVAIGLWTFFVRRGFIGGESLRDLPKSVGLGIFHAGTAPVRVLASGVGSGIQQLDRLMSTEDDDSLG